MRTEIAEIFEVIWRGLEKEALRRKAFFNKATPLLFSLEEDRELGTAAVIAQYLNEADFLTRLEYYWYHKRLERPDLTIWLPTSKRLLYLELKRVGQGWSYKDLENDLDKLERISKESRHQGDRLNGLLAVGFWRTDAPAIGLKKRYSHFSADIAHTS